MSDTETVEPVGVCPACLSKIQAKVKRVDTTGGGQVLGDILHYCVTGADIVERRKSDRKPATQLDQVEAKIDLLIRSAMKPESVGYWHEKGPVVLP